MSEILTKINKKINFQKKLKNEIENIEAILTKYIHILSQNEINELKKEKENLEKNLIRSKLSFDEKFKDYIYDFSEINEAKDITWLINDVIPSPSIGVLYGYPGVGKSTILIEYCRKILELTNDVFIIYIDADMSINKLKEIGIDELIKKYKEKFIYAGKSTNLVERTQIFLQEIVELQKKHKNRKYLIIEDSLTLLSHKKKWFY